MDVHAELSTSCAAAELFEWVDDLTRYPSWTSLVHAATVLEPDTDGRPTWSIELRARLGPMTRSKRLRMVRTVHQPHSAAVFERQELDGRRHSPWVLTVELRDTETECLLDVDLHYGGTLWTGGLLERTLSDQIGEGRQRLRDLVNGRTR
jgi:hypothetical protein